MTVEEKRAAAAAEAADKSARKLLTGASARAQYVIAPNAVRVPYGTGDLARAAHASQSDADGDPLAMLVYEPRGARAQMLPLSAVASAIASGLITPDEIVALQRIGA